MKKREANTYQMYLVVLAFNQKVPVTIKNAIPGYNNLFQKVEENKTLIGTIESKQRSSNKGYALIKNNSKAELVKHAMVLVACLKAFGLSTNNNVLVGEMKPFTKSTLLKKRDISLPALTGLIIKRAKSNLTGLQPYGITQQTIDQLEEIQTKYLEQVSKIRILINQRKELTNEIQTLITQTNQILKQLDILVNTVELRHSDFNKQYFLTRKTINYGSRTLSLRGYVLDEDKNPIFDAKINIPSLRRYARTTQKGYFEFKNLPPGILNLEISRIQYNTTTKAVGIIKGERKDIKITLTKATTIEETA
jgi:hypothetical protein